MQRGALRRPWHFPQEPGPKATKAREAREPRRRRLTTAPGATRGVEEGGSRDVWVGSGWCSTLIGRVRKPQGPETHPWTSSDWVKIQRPGRSPMVSRCFTLTTRSPDRYVVFLHSTTKPTSQSGLMKYWRWSYKTTTYGKRPGFTGSNWTCRERFSDLN